MNTNAPKPVAELLARGSAYDGEAVLFDIDGVRVELGSGETKATLSLSMNALRRLIADEVEASMLFMTGDLKIEGDMNAAVAVGEVLKPRLDRTGQPAEEASTENPNIAYLDNVGLLIGDLDGTRNRFERLGFNLAGRGTHFYENPPGTFTAWGTANHCVNFRDGGLLEFIAHYYPEHPAGLYGQQLEAFGNHWGKISLHCTSANAEVSRLNRQGHPTPPPATLYRYTDGETFSTEPDQSKRTVLFSYPTSFQDGFMLVGAEHSLGEFPIAESHFDHPNGAERMRFALIAAQNLDATVARYASALSIAAETAERGYRIALGRDSYLYFTCASELPPTLGKSVEGRPVACVGAGFDVHDLGTTTALFRERDIAFETTPWGLAINETVAGSGTIFFEEKS